jgi:hypothetical protein
MTINEVGRVNTKTGNATVSGTYTCDGQADFTILQGELSQKQGDIHVVGFFEQQDLPCGGSFKWSATITPESGKFKRGEAASLTLVAGCNALGCNVYESLDVLRLRGGGA